MARVYTIGSESLLDKIKYIPRDLACAVGKTAKGLGDLFKSKRLWAGIATSVALHGLLLGLSLYQQLRVVPSDIGQNIEVAYDPSLPPKAQQLVQQESQFVPEGYTREESAPLFLEKGKISFQSQIVVDEFSLEKGQASLIGDVIRINPNARLSTEEILAQAPIDISRSIGGTGTQSAFDKIAVSGGSPIELDTRATQIGYGVKKPVVESSSGLESKVAEIKEAGGVHKKSGFSLTGDLSPSDILSSPFPVYPEWARQKGLSGVDIVIHFCTDRYGNILPMMLIKNSTGYPEWDKSTKAALSGWKFKPSEIEKRCGYIKFWYILQ